MVPMMQDTHIRRVQAGDATRLFSFWDQMSPASKRTFAPFGQQPQLNQYEDVVNGNTNGDKYDLVAVSGDTIVGWSFVWFLNTAEPVFGLGVTDAWQGQRVGARLMDAVLAAMLDRRLPMLYLTVVTDNDRAWGLYGRRGFVRYSAYIGDEGLHFYRMALAMQDLSAVGTIHPRQDGMAWLNEPKTWKDQSSAHCLTVRTDPKSDFWRKTHYGFIRDNGHFYFQDVTGDFVADVKVSGSYHDLYDHAGLMIRLDETTWIKCGVEFFEGMQHISAVVTRDFSDWSVIPAPDNPASVWLRVTRHGEAIEVKYSYDGQNYLMLRQAHLTEVATVSVGPMCASPDGQGFDVMFEDYRVQLL